MAQEAFALFLRLILAPTQGAYEQYLAGKLIDYEVTEEQINESLAELSTPVI